MATESGIEQFLGRRGLESGVSLEQYLDATEYKLTELNKITNREFLEERTRLGIELTQITRAKIDHDVETIRKIRYSIKKQVGTKSIIGESYFHKMRRLQLADLYMFEGLMEGYPEKIDKGLQIGIDTGVVLLESGMEGDEATVQNPANASFPHWLLMTVLVLACGDEEMMGHLEILLSENYDRIVESQCMAESDARRMLLPLTVFNSNLNRVNLEGFRDWLTQFRDFGLGKLDHWQDPFFHARKLTKRKLASMQNLEYPESRSLGTYCPNLKQWMELKGWHHNKSQSQSRIGPQSPAEIFQKTGCQKIF